MNPLNGHSADHYLWADDGSCRDISFHGSTWEGVQTLLSHLSQTFELETATDGCGAEHTLLPIDGIETLTTETGAFRVSLVDGPSVISRLQIYLWKGQEGQPELEASHFPKDVVRGTEAWSQYEELIWGMAMMLGANEVFCRYENADWTLVKGAGHPDVVLHFADVEIPLSESAK